MSPPPDSKPQREFRCEYCNGLIRIPADLPPTTGPCPHCAKSITSPAPVLHPLESLTNDQDAQPEEPPLLAKGPKIRDEDELEEQTQENRRNYLPAIIAAIAILIAIALGSILALQEMKKPPAIALGNEAITENEALREAQYLRTGWKKEAYQVLDGFLKATTAEAKLPYILNGDTLAASVQEFYGSGSVNDSDTPADAFSAYDLSTEDKQRGLFMLVFDQPPQFSLKEFFRPLATLEVQYGITEADLLLSSMARVSNFAIDPMRVHAFFRKTPEGLKLDWEIFAQTKYRQLANFLETPQIGNRKVFRVFIMEDVQDPRFSIVTSRTYRIADPANTDHSARITVAVDSDVGRALSQINWLGTEGKTPQTRTSTIELEWRGNNDEPHLAIRRFLCWEFLGLGGEAPASSSENQ